MSEVQLGSEVADALNQGQAVVALESTIISHGMPYPQNVETALAVEQRVRDHGAVPATIGVAAGVLTAGLDASEIEQLGDPQAQVSKASVRDLPLLMARGESGGTTVAATMFVAQRAGIAIFATGGIGGVHRGVEQSWDISADLPALARYSVAVVCAGVKSILDIPRTLEYLETAGVPVWGYRTAEMPAFYARSSGQPLTARVEHVEELASALQHKWQSSQPGGVVIANPIPSADALDGDEISQVIEQALLRMQREGIGGKDITPYLLSEIAQQTQGRSLAANQQLVLNNAQLGAQLAVAYVRQC